MTSVLFIIPNLAPGGTEYQLVELCKALVTYRDIDVRVCTFYSERATPGTSHYAAVLDLGIPINSLSDAVVTGVPLLVRLRRYLRAQDVDVVQTFLSETNEYALLATLGLRMRLFLGVRNQTEVSGLRLIYYRALAGRAEGVVGNSRRAVDDFADRIGVREQSRRHVILNGFDASRLRPVMSRRAVRSALGIDQHSRVFVSAANMRFRHKGHDELIQAFASRRARHPSDILLLVGDGPRAPELIALSSGLGCEETVRFLGWRSDVIDVVAACDVYVSPSWKEGLSNAMAEALLLGVPVIATDVGAARELLELGEGILLPPKDIEALVAALEAPLSYPARPDVRRLDAFSLERLGREYRQLYQGHQAGAGDVPWSPGGP